ncbi:major facilitator transporter [Skermanella stibiiresistens SB22]|uniref:Major facilitator transporter n=1 Tax=Skermanella stibiiresistens SB22 TaxID=1385369 RepID=W9H4U7_9PROT|nr:MFS transporter [Skermanella stibiiresistens]EWY39717.1 major facilitator transporter [Skermanella stibiiresistens SB22]
MTALGGRLLPLLGFRRTTTAPAVSHHPIIGILGVLLGAIISTLTARITAFGLADIRGAIHAGFDEGAWITTSYTVAQMLVAPASAFLGAVFGPRRVLLISSATYGLAALALPLTGNLSGVLACQVLAGLSSGTFIPLTIGFIVRNLPPRYVVYGIAIYAMNVELSLNVSASVEGWVIDHLGWHWLFWDTALLAPLMWLCVYHGMPREPTNRDLLRGADWWGIAYASIGFALIYAALDQGNRLDWLNSGLITGMLLAGGVLIVAFVIQELTCPNPWITLSVIFRGNIPLLCLLLILLRLVMLSTAFLIPQYLITVHNYRALDVGDTLLLIAVPQFLLAPLVGTLLRHVDARVMMAIGFAAVGLACLMASRLTADWISSDFLPSQMLQAFGQSFAMTSLIFFNIKNLAPAHILTLGAVLQTSRLLGGEIGAAFMQTFVRVREQFHSFSLGMNVQGADPDTIHRLAGYTARVASRSVGNPEASERALSLLGSLVRGQAYVLAYIDGFLVIGWVIIGGLVLVALLKPAPPP